MDSKHKIEILLIEEDSDYLESILPCYGYEVISIKKYEEAISFLANNPYYNLVILDVDISNGSGWSILREIKMNPYLSEIPVILITPEKDTGRMLLDAKDGADDYIVKPFLLPNLIEKIETVLRASGNSVSEIDTSDSEIENILTTKEKDVLLLHNQGLSSKLISQKLGLNEDIVRSLMRSIFVKLSVTQNDDNEDHTFEIADSEQLF